MNFFLYLTHKLANTFKLTLTTNAHKIVPLNYKNGIFGLNLTNFSIKWKIHFQRNISCCAMTRLFRAHLSLTHNRLFFCFLLVLHAYYSNYQV